MAQTAQASVPTADRASGKHQRHLRNYLINWRYQMRFTIVIVGTSLLLTGGLGYVVMSKAHEASRVVAVRALDPTDELAQQLVQQFTHNDRIMTVVLILFALVMSVVLAMYGIMLTHKVAGPLFKVTLYLDRIREGRLGMVYNLRKGDELVDFFEHFKAAHDALRLRTEEDIALLDKASAEAGATPLGDELRAAKARKEESLK